MVASLPVLARLLRLRAGDAGAAATALALTDYTPAGVAFFNNLRVPAALLAASAIKDAFVLQGARGADIENSRAWGVVRYAYLLLMISSFAMEIGAIFFATHAGIRLQAENFEPHATSLVTMLVREFEFEYVAVRAQFVTGLLAYVIAQGLRVRFALRKYSDLAWAATFCLFSAAGRMLSYHNAHAISFGGYPGLVHRWFVLSLAFYKSHTSASKPVVVLTVATSVLAAAFAMRAVWSAAHHLLSELVSELEDEERGSDEERAYHAAFQKLRELRSDLATGARVLSDELKESLAELKEYSRSMVTPREASGWPPRPSAVVPGVVRADGPRPPAGGGRGKGGA